VNGAPRLASVASAVPPHVVRQEDARAFAQRLFGSAFPEDSARLMAVFDNGGIATRHTCVPLEWFGQDHSFGEKNALYIEHALTLAAEAAEKALSQAGLEPKDVDHLVFVSSTGVATPSIDARLANRLGFRGDFHRTPIWGLGCAGGAAGLARARDFALAQPDGRVLLIALELCTLTFQRNDLSKRNLVASSLFADGAAAAVVLGSEVGTNGHRPPLELRGSSSTLWPQTLDVMGWDVDGAGLRVIFSRDIPTIVREWVRPSLDGFLAREGLRLDCVPHIVAHPGGLKVLSAYAETLGLPPEAFRHSRDVLREFGNMSSPTCLFVLERYLGAGEIKPGQPAVLAALGPGFSAEYVLMQGAA